jgi:hypothetical protein
LIVQDESHAQTSGKIRLSLQLALELHVVSDTASSVRKQIGWGRLHPDGVGTPCCRGLDLSGDGGFEPSPLPLLRTAHQRSAIGDERATIAVDNAVSFDVQGLLD